MNYTEEMILRSDSGYCMPFEERDKNVELSLGYGNQRHPVSGETFFHHGLDFNATRYLLSALATGIVSGVGRDNEHGIYQVIRYGKYEVKYSHLADVYANFGQNVQAGMMVALSGDLLHLEVRFDGEEMNPIDFLSMLFSNIKAIEHNGSLSFPEFENFEMNTPTNYEKDKNEIEELMMHFLPTYLMDLHRGQYILPERTEQSLRNIFSLSASKNYFFDSMPSMANPLGIGQRAMPLVCKVQNLLIGDFLNYLALRHNVYLSTMNDVLKKKSSTKP